MIHYKEEELSIVKINDRWVFVVEGSGYLIDNLMNDKQFIILTVVEINQAYSNRPQSAAETIINKSNIGMAILKELH